LRNSLSSGTVSDMYKKVWKDENPQLSIAFQRCRLCVKINECYVQIYLAGPALPEIQRSSRFETSSLPDQSSDPACRRNTQPTGLASDVSGDRDRAVCHLGSSVFSAAAVKTGQPNYRRCDRLGMFSDRNRHQSPIPLDGREANLHGHLPTKSCQQHSNQSGGTLAY